MDEKSEIPTYSKILTVWSDGETRLLLDKYTAFLPEVGPSKEFRNKKDMWMKIAAELKNKSWKQCEERYKTVMKRKKNGTGVKKRKIQIKEELEEITKNDDSDEPVIQIRSPSFVRTRFEEMKKERQKNLRETLIEIAAIKEEAKDRRHRDRMERVDRIENLLKKVIQRQ